jgi:hypothetical protein
MCFITYSCSMMQRRGSKITSHRRIGSVVKEVLCSLQVALACSMD